MGSCFRRVNFQQLIPPCVGGGNLGETFKGGVEDQEGVRLVVVEVVLDVLPRDIVRPKGS
jgi:hypothetical protein